MDIEKFTKKYVIKRDSSLFYEDIYKHHAILTSKIQGKSILVIGGAGKIGSSFIKAILNFKPKKLVVVDNNENGLTELTRELRSTLNQFVPEDYITYPINFGDAVFTKMFLAHKPFHIVANFAAHKHVRSEKDEFSIQAMIENNIIKAKSLLDLLLLNKPEHFFCVSTDKAANPVNVMGATKKLMEEVIMAYNQEFKVTTARFANVAFSNGSLLDGFLNRISKRQPISCPSDVKRYFVSAEESGQICMLSCLLGNTRDIFFPKLEQEDMMNFKDITYKFFEEINIKLYECTSENEAKQISNTLSKNRYPVYFSKSNTSGEKLYEEFYSNEDNLDLLSYKSLGIIKNSKYMTLSQVDECLIEITKVFSNQKSSKNDIVRILENYLNDFRHFETGKSLDAIM